MGTGPLSRYLSGFRIEMTDASNQLPEQLLALCRAMTQTAIVAALLLANGAGAQRYLAMSGTFTATAPVGTKQKVNGEAESVEAELDVGNGQDIAGIGHSLPHSADYLDQ
jgi:hypothetical protein